MREICRNESDGLARRVEARAGDSTPAAEDLRCSLRRRIDAEQRAAATNGGRHRDAATVEPFDVLGLVAIGAKNIFRRAAGRRHDVHARTLGTARASDKGESLAGGLP